MKQAFFSKIIFALFSLFCFGCQTQENYDVIIRNGLIVDGTGGKPYQNDVGIIGDRIVKIGKLENAIAKQEIDAEGKVVSPGFINALSWAANPLLKDGRSMSDIKQGVTLEIFGEGRSLGPVSKEMRAKNKNLKWSSFGEGMAYLEQQGVSCNIASFVGATSIREYVLGKEDVKASPEQLQKMQSLVRQSMEEGALGIGSALIYPPAFFADTEELIALSQAVSEYGGIYISHLRSEGDAFEEASEELITIAREANVAAEIYHLKAAGRPNWHKLDSVLNKIEAAKNEGLTITTNMYNYEAASTGLGACLPPWVQEGGTKKWLDRLSNPEIRQKVIEAMTTPDNSWENFFLASGSPKNILLLGFDVDSLVYLNGKNLLEVAQMNQLPPAEMAVELILRNGGNISCAYFLMNEENVKRKMKLPNMSFCSDARSIAAEGELLKQSTHPRTYGNFARLLGKYVREEKVIPLEEAIHKMTLLPATKYKIAERGKLAPNFYADITIFDPEEIMDKATYENPHQYAVGVSHVLVNGELVLENGEHTGKMSGRFVKRATSQEMSVVN